MRPWRFAPRSPRDGTGPHGSGWLRGDCPRWRSAQAPLRPRRRATGRSRSVAGADDLEIPRLREGLADVLGGIEPELRETVVAAFFGGKSGKPRADRMGLDVLPHVAEELGDALDDWGVDLSPVTVELVLAHTA